MDSKSAAGVTFVLTSTPEELPDGDDRPCAYCNPTELVEEREYAARQAHPNEDLPEDVGLAMADYILRFGHEDGAGVEVPACDMCLDGCRVEHDRQTVGTEMDFEYMGDGRVGTRVVEEEDGQTVHRRVTVN